jgi:ubiquinone/menaquinone biosynthesis C-methylase UbiE
MTDVEPVSGTPGNLNSNSVGQMFDRIAPAYDILNHLFSSGRDHSWRCKLANAVDKN